MPGGPEPRADKVMTCDEILAARDVVRQIFVDDKVKRYAVELVAATRDPKAAGMPNLVTLLDNGASVRGSIFAHQGGQGAAAPPAAAPTSTPHDVKSLALDVLRHRVADRATRPRPRARRADHVIAQHPRERPVP
jgi:MoxR-like ATPase